MNNCFHFSKKEMKENIENELILLNGLLIKKIGRINSEMDDDKDMEEMNEYNEMKEESYPNEMNAYNHSTVQLSIIVFSSIHSEISNSERLPQCLFNTKIHLPT